MTNEFNGDNGVAEAAPGVAADVSSAQASENLSIPAEEKKFTQSEVGRLMAKKAREEREATEARVRNEYEQKLSQLSQAGSQHQESRNGYTDEDIRKMIQQEANKMAEIKSLERVVADFSTKIESEFQRDPGFQERYQDLNIEENPEILLFVHKLDNAGAVLNELSQNPSKYANILMLAKASSGRLATRELERLSQSIKQNEAALKEAQANPPLDHAKPSYVGSDNASHNTLADFKRRFK